MTDFGAQRHRLRFLKLLHDAFQRRIRCDGRRQACTRRAKNYLTDNSVTDLYRLIVLTEDPLYSIFFQGSSRFREKSANTSNAWGYEDGPGRRWGYLAGDR
jgi:hypothetical protein